MLPVVTSVRVGAALSTVMATALLVAVLPARSVWRTWTLV